MGIQIVKFVNGQDADTAPGPHVAVGSTVTFTYVVTDTGSGPLSNVVVTDNKLGTITGFTGDTNGNGLLDPTETWTYTATATAQAGLQTNVGTASAQDSGTPVSDSNSANYFGGDSGIHIVKFVNGQDADGPTGPHVAAGSTLTFTYVVTNTSGAPLSNVVVTDNKLGAITSFTGDTNGNGLLDPTETWTYTVTATAQVGQQTNVGTVTSTDTTHGTTPGDANPANYFGDAPGIKIVKFVNGQDADTAPGPHVAVGSTVTFTYVVTDTGNVPLANVLVTDNKLGAVTSFTGDTNGNGLLDPTETWTYTATATAQAGLQTNTGTVTAQDVNTSTTVTDSNPANYFGGAFSSVMWRQTNPQTFAQNLVQWSMNGANVTASQSIAFQGNLILPDATWSVRGTGDFNGDGNSDILWQHADGSLTAWLMNDATVVSDGPLKSQGQIVAPNSSWGVAGTGDFDGDARDDILWRKSDGTLVEWLMNGTTIASTQAPMFQGAAISPDASWNIAAMGDFNSDGHQDIMWRNSASNALQDWSMNGGTITTSVAPTFQGNAVTPDSSWSIVAAGDFNADNKTDLLWRQAGTGSLQEWQMNGAQITSSQAIKFQGSQVTPDASWSVVEIGDFNGDGKSDVLWRQSGTGALSEWQMDGAQITAANTVNSALDSSWQAQSRPTVFV